MRRFPATAPSLRILRSSIRSIQATLCHRAEVVAMSFDFCGAFPMRVELFHSSHLRDHAFVKPRLEDRLDDADLENLLRRPSLSLTVRVFDLRREFPQIPARFARDRGSTHALFLLCH